LDSYKENDQSNRRQCKEDSFLFINSFSYIYQAQKSNLNYLLGDAIHELFSEDIFYIVIHRHNSWVGGNLGKNVNKKVHENFSHQA
jgi:hypothetical protein